jgi:hypothetical protein
MIITAVFCAMRVSRQSAVLFVMIQGVRIATALRRAGCNELVMRKLDLDA